MSQWYCKQAGALAGPMSWEDLRYLASRGKLQPDDVIRRGDLGEWLPASRVAGMFAFPREPDESTIDQQGVSHGVKEGRGVTIPQTTAEIRPEGQIPPPVNESRSQKDDRKERRSQAAMVVAIGVVLLLLLLLIWWRDRPTDRLTSPTKLDETASGSGGGPGLNAGVSGSEDSGKGAGQRADSNGNDEESEDRETKPLLADMSASEQDSTSPKDQEKEGDLSKTMKEGLESAVEPPKPEQSGFTIRKFVPQAMTGGESKLGSGRASGPKPEMFRGRDPDQRDELVKQNGGTAASEEAVERGLKWLAIHQHSDGRWSLHQFMTTHPCDHRCQNPGAIHSDTAATALALLPMLGAGHSHGSGKYKDHVRAGLDWLLKDQLDVGSFKNSGRGNMYAHGQASIALCEAYAMTKDKALKLPAQRSLDYICAAQHRGGGWRYTPRSSGDTSVMGWQILALKSGQSAGLHVPKDVLQKANRYLDSVQTDKVGGRYAYMPRRRANVTMTAEGLLSRMYCGWDERSGGLQSGAVFLLENMPASASPNMYYWYYATQVMHHHGGQPWRDWNSVMRDTLVEMQVKKGHEAGSWTPAGGHAHSGGRLYMTALALCTLEVYYRHAAMSTE